ncbi:TPA: hypothetical protein DCZ39_01645 [Patescibacteria group bacterium]|nr:hypothetical protein [Candidatus Gracilibacteria bacterium]
MRVNITFGDVVEAALLLMTNDPVATAGIYSISSLAKISIVLVSPSASNCAYTVLVPVAEVSVHA